MPNAQPLVENGLLYTNTSILLAVVAVSLSPAVAAVAPSCRLRASEAKALLVR